MLKINKDPEPHAWTAYRHTPGATYKSTPELVDALMREQGFICAYCMCRIPCKSTISNEDHRIEHILCRDLHPDKELQYVNMVICCPGHMGTEDHCDRKKGNRDVSFNLFDKSFIQTLSYKTDGEIVSSNQQYNREINDVLNLNTPLLKANRKASWNAAMKELISKMGAKPWRRAIIEHYLDKYKSMHNRGNKLMFIPYCGIVVYNLHKKLQQFG